MYIHIHIHIYIHIYICPSPSLSSPSICPTELDSSTASPKHRWSLVDWMPASLSMEDKQKTPSILSYTNYDKASGGDVENRQYAHYTVPKRRASDLS